MVVLDVLASAALAGWVYLAAGHGGFWRTGGAPPAGAEPRVWPDVVAVVPARDEAAVLPETLPSLLAQEYPGRFEVVLVDDGSTDGTADTARRLADGTAVRPRAVRLRVVRAAERPDGWAGKVWAMREGVRAAGGPEFVLFTDADIAYAPGTVARLVRTAGGELDLVSRMATLGTGTVWERALVPAFVYFFALLYPFRRVGRPGARTAAAAGGCMLGRRGVLARAGGLAAIRGALIDDVALGRLIKRAGGRCRLDLDRDVVSRRPYPRPGDLWAMVARSAYDQLRYSPVLLAGTVLGLVLLFAVPPAAAVAGAVAGDPAAAVPGLAAWTIMAGTFAPMLRHYRLSPLRAPALPLIALAYTAMTVDSARRHHGGRGGVWKGRVAVRTR
ncbi:glycosyl transferase family 2 [Actinomadura sp. CNU-125]|uniref:glycosyltransferase n=1 Tax=Actinomadura sp. CNU-125 TaxID=1904961 RepID=UPI0009692CCC|nr:glycosyltransferase [Actinomadura sp. CNU-125]OLT10068.1 glycosyl transferase family 2 [Actinomadura sp. CNU-125]